MNKTEFKVTRDGKEINVIVKKPTSRQEGEASIEAASYINGLFQQGKKLMPKSKIAEYIEEQNLWSAEKIAELKSVNDKIAAGEEQLKRGGKTKTGEKFSKEQAKQLAVDMRVWRYTQINLLTENSELYDNCLENVKEDRRFDYLVSCCSLDDTGKPIFRNLDHYLDEAGEEYAMTCAIELKNLIYSMDRDWSLDLPETKWLMRYKFADDEGTLLNDDGVPLTQVVEEPEEEIEFTEFEDEEAEAEVEALVEQGLETAEVEESEEEDEDATPSE